MTEPTPTPSCLLAATDFSAPATLAMQRAAQLAREHGAALHLAHVLNRRWLDELRQWLRADTPWAAQLHDAAQAQLRAAADALDTPSQTTLLDGEPVPALCALAQDLQATLLLIGARSDPPLHQRVLGGTAERLLRQSSVPLLVVRQAAEQPYRRVLVPVDFSRWSLPTLRLVQALAPHATLVLHHGFTVPFEEKLRFAGVSDALLSDYREHARVQARDALLALAREAALPDAAWQPSVTEGDAPQRILEVAAAQRCDLIAIGKHGRQAAEELLLGSVTRHVLEEAEGDVLVSTAHGEPA